MKDRNGNSRPRLTGPEREAARIMYHIMGYSKSQCALFFGCWPCTMRRVIDNEVLPIFKNYGAGQYKKDRQEVLAYIAQNGPCSVFDIQMCLHQGRNAVLGHLAALLDDNRISKRSIRNETSYYIR